MGVPVTHCVGRNVSRCLFDQLLVGVPVTRCVGLNVSHCFFDQLVGLGKVINRGLSRAENVDSLIWDVKCLHKGRGGEIDISRILESHEVEMVASWEIFAFSLSVGRCGQLRAAGWKRIACVAFLGHLLIN